MKAKLFNALTVATIAAGASLPMAPANATQNATQTPAPTPTSQGTMIQAAAPAAQKWSEEGEATWYGPRHAGRRTTSGERFDPRKMTAAHPSLPLGTWVRVTDQRTGKSVTVRINDREPPHGVRVIDLSQGAANKLGIVARGVADVTVEVAEAPSVLHGRH